MSVTCPRGHQSSSEDYCDECGARIGAPSASTPVSESPAPTPSSSTTSASTTAASSAAGEPCPCCATSRSGDDRYCEVCGYDFVERPTPAVPATGAWQVTVTADRDYHDRLGPPVEFPALATSWSVELTGDEVTIGRRSRSQGIEPDIDLGASPEDPGISHRHASFVRTADDQWSLVDHGSTNGTALNGSADLLAPGASIPLSDGDRVHLGAWTTIMIERIPPLEQGL
jgi:hypothetical protein